jgi:hypothetical protein
VVKEKLDAEALTPGLSIGVKTVIVAKKARSARSILLFIFFSLVFRLKGCYRQTSSTAMSQETSRKRSERSFLAGLEPMDFDTWAEHILTSLDFQVKAESLASSYKEFLFEGQHVFSSIVGAEATILMERQLSGEPLPH